MRALLVLAAVTLAGCATARVCPYEAEHAAVWRDYAEALDAERRGDHGALIAAVTDADAHLRRMHDLLVCR